MFETLPHRSLEEEKTDSLIPGKRQERETEDTDSQTEVSRLLEEYNKICNGMFQTINTGIRKKRLSKSIFEATLNHFEKSNLKLFKVAPKSTCKLTNLQTSQVPADKNCTICMDSSKRQMAELKCFHVFHLKCIRKWSKSSSLCPVCRGRIS